MLIVWDMFYNLSSLKSKLIIWTLLLFQNPAPGLQVFKPPLPYAEVDEDYHLCPLPRNRTAGKSGRQGRKYLERQVNTTDSGQLYITFSLYYSKAQCRYSIATVKQTPLPHPNIVDVPVLWGISTGKKRNVLAQTLYVTKQRSRKCWHETRPGSFAQRSSMCSLITWRCCPMISLQHGACQFKAKDVWVLIGRQGGVFGLTDFRSFGVHIVIQPF